MCAKKATISLRDAAEAACVPYPTCSEWIRKGLIRPRGYVGRQAVKIRLSSKDVRELKILANLRGVLPMQQLRKALRYLREDLKHNPLSSGRFFVIGGPPSRRHLIKICSTGEAIELLGKNRGQLMVPLLFDETENCKET